VLGWLLPDVGERTRNLITGLTLRAVALAGRGEPEQACAILEQTLLQAEPEGYVRLFLDEGAPLLALLRRLAARPGPAAAYAQRLLAAEDGGPAWGRLPAAPQHLLAAPPDDPQDLQLGGQAGLLSPRELEVLHLIAAGLSNSDIATRLVVAESTVKKHVHNIFSKLGAQSRTKALVRARELGLLQSSF
jgi:LuxR family maltose regulon positive regulatory protein